MKKLLLILVLMSVMGCAVPEGGVKLPKWSGVFNTPAGPVILRDGD